MLAIRWPELDTVKTELKEVNEFYYATEVGPLLKGILFPVSQLAELEQLKRKIEIKKRELAIVEAVIYTISRDFSK